MKTHIDQFLKPISLILSTDNRNVKLYTSLLLIIKKIVTSNLLNSVCNSLNKNNLNNVITILKDIIENSSDEFLQIKVLETLLLLLNPELLSINQVVVDNILTICFKMIGHKNINIKNTVSAILQQLTSISFYTLDKVNVTLEDKTASTNRIEENTNEVSPSNKALTSRVFSSPSKRDDSKAIVNSQNNDVYKVCQSLFKEYILISEGKGRVHNTIYTKALGK